MDNTKENGLFDLLNNININLTNRKVLAVRLEDEIIYEDGSFYICRTRDLTKRRKISRQKAKELIDESKLRESLLKKRVSIME